MPIVLFFLFITVTNFWNISFYAHRPAIFASVIVERFGVRKSVILSGLLYTAGNIGTAFSNSLSLSIFTFGIIGGNGYVHIFTKSRH